MSEVISIRASKDDKEVFDSYAKSKGLSLSQFLIQSAKEKIEEEYDFEVIKAYEKAKVSKELKLEPIEDLFEELELD